jgi:hypothetical protein
MMLDFVIPIDKFINKQGLNFMPACLFTIYIHFRGSSNRIDTIPNLIIADINQSWKPTARIVDINLYFHNFGSGSIEIR